MFREMRRKDRLLDEKETINILLSCSYGVLACIGDNDYAYAVPLNYVYYNNKIYFHSAKEGNKIDSIKKNNKVSFSVVEKEVVLSEKYSTYFRSAIVFGKARIVSGNEKIEAFRALVEKYSSERPQDEKEKMINNCTNSHIVAIDIEYISGKESFQNK
ncbi:pyridoxamine 5'-phosphate oxidase family protein [Marinitoga sp. 38H-ov]|uniref:pyridoxamine 5'-phosphate oxidase family protein n=1 Tax=Marinitoga sp. 38H-ov TaxID=1755814 RepID=UPI0013EB66E1|nr:pyridoxamine 5'-phosphate oxidase family protein [Marinitoga sp. 38H-ov]KAF2955719.1 5-nitroimidazole antibiotic resistance protein [Marinitoga sp. 38H-ov]